MPAKSQLVSLHRGEISRVLPGVENLLEKESRRDGVRHLPPRDARPDGRDFLQHRERRRAVFPDRKNPEPRGVVAKELLGGGRDVLGQLRAAVEDQQVVLRKRRLLQRRALELAVGEIRREFVDVAAFDPLAPLQPSREHPAGDEQRGEGGDQVGALGRSAGIQGVSEGRRGF